MSLVKSFSTHFRDYPYRKHMAAVGLFLIISLLPHGLLRGHEPDKWLAAGTIILALLCSPKRRLFWFFVGLFVGQAIGEVLGLISAGVPGTHP